MSDRMKKMDQIDRIIKKYEKWSTFQGTVEKKRIIEAEEQLNVCFPEDYERFLKLYGAGVFGSLEIYGITLNAELQSIPNGIWATVYLRKNANLPQSYVVIGFDGIDQYYCLDTRKRKNLDTPVVLFSRETAQGQKNDSEKIAESFAEFMLESMKMEIDFMTKIVR